MKFPRELFLNDDTDLVWLRETHVKHLSGLPAFESFIIFGNDDCPSAVELYAKREPLYNDQPVLILVQGEDGDLAPQPVEGAA